MSFDDLSAREAGAPKDNDLNSFWLLPREQAANFNLTKTRERARLNFLINLSEFARHVIQNENQRECIKTLSVWG